MDPNFGYYPCDSVKATFIEAAMAEKAVKATRVAVMAQI